MLFHEYLLQNYSKDKIILNTLDASYTWSEVVGFSNVLTTKLLKMKITMGDRILLIMENGLEAVISQIACSKIGAIFVPVSPKEPRNRLDRIVSQIQPNLILATRSDIFQNSSTPILVLDNLLFDDPNIWKKPSMIETKLDDTCPLYIICTSGTTGEPKGIVMSHRSTINFFKAIVNYCNLSSNCIVGSISPLQFDFSILDLGLALGSKACITIIPQSLALMPKKLVQLIHEKNITQFNSVPSIWSLIIKHAREKISILCNLTAILYAGESFPLKNIRILQSQLPQLRIINCFGQSESIACSFWDVPKPLPIKTKELSFGKGYEGNTFYIVEEKDKLITVPFKVGELWINNPSLFSSYWNNYHTTKERLIENPFEDSNNMSYVYKTGDLVYRDEEGLFYYVGRIDNQVKINGNRVELEEISQCFDSHPDVDDCVSFVDTSNSENKILLFLSVKTGASITEDMARKICRDNLPSYMIPTYVFLRKELPLTLNGKIDKKKLQEEFHHSISN